MPRCHRVARRQASGVAQDPQVPAASDLDGTGGGFMQVAGPGASVVAAGRGRPASRTALASASRSSVVGGGVAYSPPSLTTSQPRGAVSRSACRAQRS